MKTDVYRFAASQYGLLSLAQARELGLKDQEFRNLVRRRGWEYLAPGVLAVPGCPPSWRQHLKALHLWGGAQIAVSHRAAAALFQLPGFPETTVEITTARNSRSLRPDVVAHEARPNPEGLTEKEGLPVMNLLFTLLVLGAVVERSLVEKALNACLHGGDVSVRGLLHVLRTHGGRGRRGAATLGALLAERGYGDAPPDSVLEASFLKVLRAAGLPVPDRQVALWGPEGFIGFIDFAYKDLRLAIELDGRGTHGDAEHFQTDRERDRRLAAVGWHVLRFTWLDVHQHPDRVVAELRRIMARLARETANGPR